tara:strand:+ start:263 stop:529 length:267 start_codon:yes stop_codon:yes gene_type:complete
MIYLDNNIIKTLENMTTKSRRQNITALAAIMDEQSKTIKTLADSLLELSKEVRQNREYIEQNAALSKKTVEAIVELNRPKLSDINKIY